MYPETKHTNTARMWKIDSPNTDAGAICPRVTTAAFPFCTMALLVWLGGCNSNETLPSVSVQRNGEFVLFDSEVVRLGLVVPEGTQNVDFHLTNIADQSVSLEAGKPSCGCMRATISPHTRLSPHENANVSLILDTHGRTRGGLLAESIVITAAIDNAQGQRKLEYHILKVEGFTEGLSNKLGRAVSIRSRPAGDVEPQQLELVLVTRDRSIPFRIEAIKSDLTEIRLSADDALLSERTAVHDCFVQKVSIPMSVGSFSDSRKGQLVISYRLGDRSADLPIDALLISPSRK
jgi:hypothetical protein